MLKQFKEINEKNIIIFLTISLVLLLLCLILVFSKTFSLKGAKDISKEYKKIAIENELLQGSSFKDEHSDTDIQDNMKTSAQAIKNNLLKKSLITGYDKKQIEDAFINIDHLILDKKYGRSLEVTKESIDKLSSSIVTHNTYVNENKKSLDVLLGPYAEKEIKTTDYWASGSWSMATITPSGYRADPGFVLFRKKEGGWEKVLGPVTMFDNKTLTSMNAPEVLLKDPALLINKDILKPLTY